MDTKQHARSGSLKEFSRFAHDYDRYNIIQSQAAEALVSNIPVDHYPCIVDLGCGSGEVYKNIRQKGFSFDHFTALDSSQKMLDIHPVDLKVEKICADFNTQEAFETFSTDEKSILISSSALQWSHDLDFTFSHLSKKAKQAYFAIFTASTFKTLHQIADIRSPIYTEAVLKNTIDRYYQAEYETYSYKLYFDSTYDMLNYIKKSGVSGGEKKLTYKQVKELIAAYPLDYLEFEVLFVTARSCSFA
ncbi:MAG: methyltransferase [Campylobacterales bacterium]|nr:methyltransferase [Campylobacterales bacterium]